MRLLNASCAHSTEIAMWQSFWYAQVRFLAAALSCFLSAAYGSSRLPDHVSLRESTIMWSTVKHATTADGGFVTGSLDDKRITNLHFKSYVLENRFLKITLVPAFGGRILSLIYKPTGHEQLYRTEVGVPFGINQGIFYYDWMMVYGGIFPTLPDAEHGKTWLIPWNFEVVKESAEEVTISMSLKDDFSYARAPSRFRAGSTGIEATTYVTLKAGHAAIEVRTVLKNPSDRTIDYEYWTCTTLAPGSDALHPQATGGAEIIAPVEVYRTPEWWKNLSDLDPKVGPNKSRFEKLRFFKNWPTMGIAYAEPDMQGGNFWGVINHDNNEGIIRIADNRVTPGLKMWTWGFSSFTRQADPHQRPSEQQPYIELWAGVSDEFFHSARLPALGEVSIREVYSPIVGMSNVTQANENVLVNLSARGSEAKLEFFIIAPAERLRVTLRRGDTVFFSDNINADPKNGNHVSAAIPASQDQQIKLTIMTAAGKELIVTETSVQ